LFGDEESLGLWDREKTEPATVIAVDSRIEAKRLITKSPNHSSDEIGVSFVSLRAVISFQEETTTG
jgi:hypothetical protein